MRLRYLRIKYWINAWVSPGFVNFTGSLEIEWQSTSRSLKSGWWLIPRNLRWQGKFRQLGRGLFALKEGVEYCCGGRRGPWLMTEIRELENKYLFKGSAALVHFPNIPHRQRFIVFARAFISGFIWELIAFCEYFGDTSTFYANAMKQCEIIINYLNNN